MPTHVNCNDIVDLTFQVGKLFLYVAIIAALAMATAEAIARFKKGGSGEKRNITNVGDWLGAFKDLLVALGSLPAWFAIFLAGGALIWFARDTLGTC